MANRINPPLEIKHWYGGISPFNDRGPIGSAKFTGNLDIRKANDSLSCGQALTDEGLYGISHSSSPSLSPSPSQSPSASGSASQSKSGTPSQSDSPSASPSASKSLSPSASSSPSSSASSSPSPSAGLVNVYEDLVIAFVKGTDGHTYEFGNAGNIYRRFTDGYVRNVYKDPDGSIKGAIEKPSSTGVTYLQWATDTKVKRKLLPGASDWSDVTTVADNLTGADWHTMKQVGGANYIANGSKLALVGYDDSWTNEALDLIPGNIAKTLIERNGRTVVGTFKTGFPNKGVNGMIDCEVPLSQIGTDGEIFFTNFTDSMPVRRFPGGGRVNPYGVANVVDQVEIFDWIYGADSWVDKQTMGNMSMWGVFGADTNRNGVYYFGRKNKEQPFALNLEYALEVDEIGAVVNVEGVTLVSYRSGTSFGVKAVDSTTKATGTFESLEFRSPTKEAETLTVWEATELFMEPLLVGCSVEYHYKLDHASSWTQAYTADGALSFSSTGGKKAVFRIGAQGDVFEEKIVLNPSGNTTPEVLRSRTKFS